MHSIKLVLNVACKMKTSELLDKNSGYSENMKTLENENDSDGWM